jgi:glycine cleavage system H protein
MSELRFSRSHEWIRVDGGTATLGISRYAADQLGDVVFVELPSAGRVLASGAQAAVVESVKAASEIYAPFAGTVTESNRALGSDPAKLNADPEGGAWLFRMTLAEGADMAALMTRDQYGEYLKTL